MINIAFRGHDVPDVHSFEDLGKKLQDYGASGVQLALPVQFPEISDPGQLSPGLGQYCRQSLGKYGIVISVLGCYGNIIHPDIHIREQVLARFESYLDYARFFGAPIVATETGSYFETPNRVCKRNFTQEAYELTRGVIEKLVERAECTGTIVGIEPGINHPIFSIERTLQLLEDIPSRYLGIVFDPTALVYRDNFRKQDVFIQQAFDSFADSIVAVHACDYRVDSLQEQVIRCNNGEGILNTELLLQKVNEYRPYIPVVFEQTRAEAIRTTVQRYRNF